MSNRVSRRRMLQTTALAGVGVWTATTGRVRADAAMEKLNVACIGIGGRGGANVNGVAGENIVALCDVDEARAGSAFDKHPKAKKYADFRKMLDEMEKEIDAVVVSTPDHTHVHPGVMAMKMGKHLYCEKPLAHAVGEVRLMMRVAKETKVATQLGNQRHAYDNMHRVVELIKAKAIGDVKEVHAWVGGDRGMPAMPTVFPEVPAHLNYDLWLGPAAERPYSPEYVPYKWRFWWDFGTGETGNWGCHILDIPYWALDLVHCTKVSATGPEVDAQRTPKAMEVKYEFPARGDLPPVTLNWYHTKTGPAVLKENGLPHLGSGVLFVGSEGMLLCDFGKRRLYPLEKFSDYEPPEKTIPDSPGFHKEWIIAAKGGPASTCNFDYTGPMAETVLLGNVAYRTGQSFDWDADAIRGVDCDAIDPHIHPTYRKGWELDGV